MCGQVAEARDLDTEVRLDGGFVEFVVPSPTGHAVASRSEKLD